jgi:hypothetical protein
VFVDVTVPPANSAQGRDNRAKNTKSDHQNHSDQEQPDQQLNCAFQDFAPPPLQLTIEKLE